MKNLASIADIKSLHKAYANVNLDARVATLRKMVLWFETYIPFARGRWNATQIAHFESGIRIRGRAMDGRTPLEEADTALRIMLRKWEAACNDISIPELAQTISAFESKRRDLEAKAAKRVAQYQGLLDTLHQAFSFLGLTFAVDDRCKTVAAAPGGRILIHPDAADSLLGVPSSDLFFRIAPAALKASALTVAPNGGMVQDFSAYAAATSKMLEALKVMLGNSMVTPIPQAPSKPAKQTRKPAVKPATNFSAAPGVYRGSKGEVFSRLFCNEIGRAHV